MVTIDYFPTITAIILAHFKERENNLKRIIDDLMAGTIRPNQIIVFIDDPDINFNDERTIIIRSSHSFLPIIRFALGTVCDTDFCFFIDDDLSVRKNTLENFALYAHRFPHSVLGLEGSILGETETPYTDDTCINRRTQSEPLEVDIVIRSYFVPVSCLMAGLELRVTHPEFPKKSLDDIFLCLGNKYLNKNKNYVIPVNEESDLTELPSVGVGQTTDGDHYKNRNIVCRKLMDIHL